MRITILTLAAAFSLGLTGSALAQSTTAPAGTEHNLNNPGSVKSNSEKGLERTGAPHAGAPDGNPSQDTTGSVGHPKSSNSNGATSAPAAR